MGYSGGSISSLVDDAEEGLDAAYRRIVDRCGRRLEELVVANTPVSKDPFGEAKDPPGTLKAGWELGEITVNGSSYTVDVVNRVYYSHWVEFGTEPHRITARPGHTLRFRDRAGNVVYAHSVNHPGTIGQRMMGRAIATLAQEWSGIAREELGRA